MPGLLSFHAHPDDEVISTGGTLAHYAAQGEQVVVVTATDGAEGEIHNYDDPDSLKPQLADLRREEVKAALAVLGVSRHEFLGYRDSGMMGTEANDHADAFWRAPFLEATGRLVSIIRRYQPEVMTIYDPFGGYAHPDHIQVHRVGLAAFFAAHDPGWFPLAEGEEPWEPKKLYWSTWPRSRIRRFAELSEEEEQSPEDEEENRRFRDGGMPDEDISVWMEVTDQVERKLTALRKHRTQIPDDWFLLKVPEEHRAELIGREPFLRVFSRVDSPLPEAHLFAGLR
jgi:N-acetyl-1-D-myo-inositol-2-amino-2-deoxy-alpha-D-glucopyranoside deacetylase